MSRKTKRVPHSATRPANQKSVRVQSPGVSEKPSWRFSTVDLDGPFAWPKGQDIENNILAKLHQFDSMKWSEIVGSSHHAIGKDSLSKLAKDRLEAIGMDDVDEVFSFHFSGKPRIIGIQDRGVVKLLWWDPEHQVCPSTKKHT